MPRTTKAIQTTTLQQPIRFNTKHGQFESKDGFSEELAILGIFFKRHNLNLDELTGTWELFTSKKAKPLIIAVITYSGGEVVDYSLLQDSEGNRLLQAHWKNREKIPPSLRDRFDRFLSYMIPLSDTLPYDHREIDHYRYRNAKLKVIKNSDLKVYSCLEAIGPNKGHLTHEKPRV